MKVSQSKYRRRNGARAGSGLQHPRPCGNAAAFPPAQVSKAFDSKEQFIGEVHQPFGARFAEPFRPVAVHGVYADGDTVVVLWGGEGTRLDGKPYENTYAWFMRFREGLVVEATAFFDSIAFDKLWNEVTPAN